MNMLRKSVRVSGLGLFLIQSLLGGSNFSGGPGFDPNSFRRRCNRQSHVPQSRKAQRMPASRYHLTLTR